MDMREAVEHVLLIPDETELSAEALLDKIKEYVRSQRNIALDCVAFEERKQAIGESFDAFLIAIKTLARDADLCDSCVDRRLVTKIMSEIRDKKTRMKLLAISPLPDLQKVTDLCRSEESAKLDEARMGRAKSEKNVYRARSKSKDISKSSSCRRCGKCTCPPKGQTVCPATGKTCLNCHKKGHFASVCFSRPNVQCATNNKRKANGHVHGPSLLLKSGGDKYFVIPHILHATSMRKFGFIRQCVNLHSEKNVRILYFSKYGKSTR